MGKLNDYQKKQIREILADKLGFDNKDVKEDTNLINDLGMDSLDAIELLMEFEKIFNCNIPDSLAENIKNVSDIYYCISKCIK